MYYLILTYFNIIMIVSNEKIALIYMKIVQNKITLDELKQMSVKMFGNLVKAVVDVEKRIMAVDGELHSDEEVLLIESGSKQQNLWGINLYPDTPDDDFIEFDSMINLRPNQSNRTRGVEDESTQKQIIEIVNTLVEKL